MTSLGYENSTSIYSQNISTWFRSLFCIGEKIRLEFGVDFEFEVGSSMSHFEDKISTPILVEFAIPVTQFQPVIDVEIL